MNSSDMCFNLHSFLRYKLTLVAIENTIIKHGIVSPFVLNQHVSVTKFKEACGTFLSFVFFVCSKICCSSERLFTHITIIRKPLMNKPHVCVKSGRLEKLFITLVTIPRKTLMGLKLVSFQTVPGRIRRHVALGTTVPQSCGLNFF